MRTFVLIISLIAFAFSSSFFSYAQEGKKVALVIGNAAYQNGVLRNPVNDASDMASALKRIGFQVYSGNNLNKKAMYDLIERFGNGIKNSDIALVYYSGHGVQIDGENFLIPVAADISKASDVESEGVPLHRILGRLNEGNSKTNVIILDACRDNPFPSASRGMQRGLAVVQDKPPESIIVYSTEEGRTADDGDGRNGAFTEALLKHIEEPKEFVAVLREVSNDVRATTEQRQVPARYDNLDHEVYLSDLPPAKGSGDEEKPSIVISKAYGSLEISSVTSGALYIDGRKVADINAGAKASLGNVAIGNHALEVRYADGQVEKKDVSIGNSGLTVVNFTLAKREPTVQAPKGKVQVNMVPVDGGIFTMGDTIGNGESNEKPTHQVAINGFFISATEITQAQWLSVMEDNPSNNKGGNLPVENISWLDAVSFCNKLSAREGLTPAYSVDGTMVAWDQKANGYRLPTEAEWEYAAKGGKAGGGTAWSGDSQASNIAWYNENSKGMTHPVAQKRANQLGLFDMSGNVCEWCWDWQSSYTTGKANNPSGPRTGNLKVIRGGGWGMDMSYARVSYRDFNSPDYTNDDLGMRIARTQF
jgi:formylglycine-generating enzyme required for sulfatase activity